MYTLDAMLEAHAEVQAIPFKPGQSHVESVVAGVMLWSDSTHLASFGMASLWPVYLFFGNLSKYTWAKPTLFAAHHIAYMPKVYLIIFLFLQFHSRLTMIT
jgi:Plavaka transposase